MFLKFLVHMHNLDYSNKFLENMIYFLFISWKIKFWVIKEIKEIITYLKVILNPNDIINNILFHSFQKGIPKMNGCLNLIFQMLYTISLHQEGKKYLIEDDKTKK